MRKNKVLLWLSFLFLGIASCDSSFLDQTSTSDLDEKVVFGDSTYASGFLTNIYTSIGFDTDPDRFGGHNSGSSNGGLQVACDEAEFRSSSSITTGMAFATGTVNPVIVTDDAWSTCYKQIRACNTFLKKIGTTPMTESTRQQYMAECRFLRAWYYYTLVRHYGGVPLIGDTLYRADDKVNAVRATYEECINYITDEVKQVLAMNVLRPRTSGSANGRISEGACYGFLSRVCLDAASPLHNNPEGQWGTAETKNLLGYPSYSKERWLEAYKYAKSVMTMTSGDYRLFEVHADNDNGDVEEPGWGYYAVQIAADFADVTSYKDFSYPYGAYQEMILQYKEPESIRMCDNFCPPSCGGDKYGGYIYWDLCEAFPMIDGKYYDDPACKYYQTDAHLRDSIHHIHPKMYRDPRFSNVVTVNNMKQMSAGDPSHMVYTCIGDGATEDAIYSGTPTGLYIKKMVHRNCAGNYFVAPPVSRPLIRYAEILLNYAEAVNEYYGPDFSESLGNEEMSPLEVLKRIRRRAGIEAGADNMYGLKSNMTQEEMRDAIRLERRLELCFEGFRFFDVRRWMIADKTDNATMHGLELTHKGSNMNEGYTWRVVDVRTHVFRKSMYFWPIPYSETVKNKELIQNPYYETTND